MDWFDCNAFDAVFFLFPVCLFSLHLYILVWVCNCFFLFFNSDWLFHSNWLKVYDCRSIKAKSYIHKTTTTTTKRSICTPQHTSWKLNNTISFRKKTRYLPKEERNAHKHLLRTFRMRKLMKAMEEQRTTTKKIWAVWVKQRRRTEWVQKRWSTPVDRWGGKHWVY